MSGRLRILGQAVVDPGDPTVLLYQVPPLVDPATGDVSSKGKIIQTLISEISITSFQAGSYTLWLVKDHIWEAAAPAWSAEYAILTDVSNPAFGLDVFHIGMTLPGDSGTGAGDEARTPALFFTNAEEGATYSVTVLGTEIIRNE